MKSILLFAIMAILGLASFSGSAMADTGGCCSSGGTCCADGGGCCK